MKIPITRPLFGDEERDALVKPLDTGWVVQGPYVKEFERKFAAFAGAPHAIATTSCTTALHLAVSALGLKPGDEVIVPAFTFIATPNVVEYTGATPVFCDVDLATFNIDASRIAALVTPRTVGIIPVHMFGLCADMDAVAAAAQRHGLWVIEDAACGFGAWHRGRHAGTIGDHHHSSSRSCSNRCNHKLAGNRSDANVSLKPGTQNCTNNANITAANTTTNVGYNNARSTRCRNSNVVRANPANASSASANRPIRVPAAMTAR